MAGAGLCWMLLALPPEVFCITIATLLDFNSLCRLDSAFCNNALRHEFLSMLANNHFLLIELPIGRTVGSDEENEDRAIILIVNSEFRCLR